MTSPMVERVAASLAKALESDVDYLRNTYAYAFEVPDGQSGRKAGEAALLEAINVEEIYDWPDDSDEPLNVFVREAIKECPKRALVAALRPHIERLAERAERLAIENGDLVDE